ncbi:MAG: DUF4286 family protein [Chitinophagaceae bacterium]|nr:DUF4286 family protein [Chitinophagaceae bacterium]
MIVFNHTVKIFPEIEKEWLQWLRYEHIPAIMATGLFDSFRLYRLLDQEDAEEGTTFTIQFFTSSWERYQQYIDHFYPAFGSKALARWGARFIGFRTVMELVN